MDGPGCSRNKCSMLVFNSSCEDVDPNAFKMTEANNIEQFNSILTYDRAFGLEIGH